MKLRFVWVGKTKRAPVLRLIEDYIERIGSFAPVEVTEIRDRDDSGKGPDRIVEREGKEILSKVGPDSFLIVLDERGREFDSCELARLLEKQMVAGTRRLTFVIGGFAGVSDAVKERADLIMALSRMTLTHEMARLLLTEQVYRAFTIAHGLPYQK